MAESNIVAITAALKTTIASVPGIKNVYDHFPENAGTPPLVIFSITSWRMLFPAFGEMSIEWTFAGWIAVEQTNFKAAAAAITSLLPGLQTAIGHALGLAGALPDGQALLTGGRSGRLTVGGTAYHAMEITITAVEMFQFEYAL